MNKWEWMIIGGIALVTWLVVFAGMTARPDEITVDLRDADGKNLCGEVEGVGCSASMLGTGHCNSVRLQIVPCVS